MRGFFSVGGRVYEMFCGFFLGVGGIWKIFQLCVGVNFSTMISKIDTYFHFHRNQGILELFDDVISIFLNPRTLANVKGLK